MNVLPVVPVNPVAVNAVNTAELVHQPVTGSLAQSSKAAGTAALSIQDLTQSLFHQNLQAAALFPVLDPVSGSAGLAQDAIASLLATLNPAQAAAAATPAATPPTSLGPPPNLNPSAGAAPLANALSSAAPSSAAPVATAQDLPASQDGFWASLSPDFAMQTALRFGAGVAIQAAPTALSGTAPGTGLVRDAASVLRLGNLQPHAGHPGPEAFTQSQPPTQQILQTYEAGATTTAPQGTSAVDLLA
jgi:hypothetical protein